MMYRRWQQFEIFQNLETGKMNFRLYFGNKIDFPVLCLKSRRNSQADR